MTVVTGTKDQLDRRPQDFVAAIHAVINANRTLTEHELLITTACELLVEGALPTADVVRKMSEVWTGVGISRARVEAALRTAVDAGLIIATNTDAGAMWCLTPAGKSGAGGSRDWAECAYARTARQLQELADKDLRSVSDVEARLWVDLLAQALFDGIREAYSAFVGDVTLLTDGTLAPGAFDRKRAFRALRTPELDDGVVEFLKAAVLAALDRTDPFGNDLVNHIATGCVLLAFLAGRDRATVRDRLEDLTDEEFVLDTPVLVPLIGSAKDAEPIVGAIEATLSAGGHVVVAEHTVQEFTELVEAIGAEHIPALTQALSGGLNARAYCTSVDSPALETWVAALYEGRYRSWEEFEKEAHRIKQRLGELGVTVRPHGNGVPETVAACSDALGTELSERRHGRAAAAIERDANTMAMVLRHRGKHQGDGGLWPGSWIVTTDRHIGPAYRRVSQKDGIPVALSMAQWAVMIMSCRKTVTVKELAAITTPLVRRQAILAIAARYPAEVALEIARVLAPDEGPASTDLRVAQLASGELTSMDALLDPHNGLPAGMTPMSLASDVLARRQKRMDSQRLALAARADEDRLRARAYAVSAKQAAEWERSAREQAEKQLRESVGDISGLKNELAQTRQRVKEEQKLGCRKGWLAAFLVTCGCVLVIALVLGLYVLAGATFITVLVIWKEGAEWITEPSQNARRVLLAGLVESLGLFQILIH